MGNDCTTISCAAAIMAVRMDDLDQGFSGRLDNFPLLATLRGTSQYEIYLFKCLIISQLSTIRSSQKTAAIQHHKDLKSDR